MFFDFCVALFRRLVKASHGFSDFLFKVTEKSFHNCKHLNFSLANLFFQLLLLFDFYSLMLFHVKQMIIELFDVFFEKTIQISNYFMDTTYRKRLTSRIDHRFFRIYVHQCVS